MSVRKKAASKSTFVIQYSLVVSLDTETYDDGMKVLKDALAKVSDRQTFVTASVKYEGKTYAAWQFDFTTGKPMPNAQAYGDTHKFDQKAVDEAKAKKHAGKGYVTPPSPRVGFTGYSVAQEGKATPAKPLRKRAAGGGASRSRVAPPEDLPDVDFAELDAVAEEVSGKSADAIVKAVKKPLRKRAK